MATISVCMFAPSVRGFLTSLSSSGLWLSVLVYYQRELTGLLIWWCLTRHNGGGHNSGVCLCYALS